MPFHAVAARDVHLFLNGLQPPDVAHRFGTSFPRRPETVNVVVLLSATVFAVVAEAQPDLVSDPSKRACIIGKVADFVRGRGRQSYPDDGVAIVRRAAAMMALRPEVIDGGDRLADMARSYDDLAGGRNEAMMRRPHDVPARPVLWTDNGYALTELAHPWHVVDEGEALDHCIGRMPYGEPFVPERLPYWRFIAADFSRVFSITYRDRPICTLHVSLASMGLVEMQSYRYSSLLGVVPMAVLSDVVRVLKALFPDLQPGSRLAPDVLETIGVIYDVNGWEFIPLEKPAPGDTPDPRISARALARILGFAMTGRVTE